MFLKCQHYLGLGLDLCCTADKKKKQVNLRLRLYVTSVKSVSFLIILMVSVPELLAHSTWEGPVSKFIFGKRKKTGFHPVPLSEPIVSIVIVSGQTLVK